MAQCLFCSTSLIPNEKSLGVCFPCSKKNFSKQEVDNARHKKEEKQKQIDKEKKEKKDLILLMEHKKTSAQNELQQLELKLAESKRKQYSELILQKQKDTGISVSTLFTFNNLATKVKGIVTHSTYIAVDEIVGDSSMDVDRKITSQNVIDIKQDLILCLMVSAKEVLADAILGLSFSTSSIGGNYIEISCVGTAVTLHSKQNLD